MIQVIRGLGVAVELSLAALAIALLAVAHWRTPHAVTALRALMFVVFGITIVQSGRSGLLGSTPKEIYVRARTTGRLPADRLANWSLIVGVIADIVIRWNS